MKKTWLLPALALAALAACVLLRTRRSDGARRSKKKTALCALTACFPATSPS